VARLERMERPGLAYWSSRLLAGRRKKGDRIAVVLPLAGRTKRKGMPQLGFGGWKIERVCLLCLVALTEEGCSC
jgi:hypothetical protein